MTKPRVTVLVKKSNKQTKKNMTGKRKSPTPIGQVMRALGGIGGGYLGGMLGAPGLGGAAGHQLGAMASRWMGFGDYQVNRNSIMTKSADGIPNMHKEDQSIVLRHKEFVGTLNSTQDFTVQYALPLNPGMNSFPWLATIAGRFQEYRFRGVVFHYIPASGSAIASTNSALGTVMLQTTYRASDANPTSKVEMLNEYCSNEVVPSESVIHPVECDPKQNPFSVQYVRSVPVPAGESVLNYDLGKTFIATQGQQAAGNYLGDIWVTYEVELFKPVFSSSVTINPLSETDFSGATTTNFYGTPVFTDDTLGLTYSGRTITFPNNAGTRFVVSNFFSDSNVSATTWAATTVTNGTMNWTRANMVLSGSAQILHICCFTKTDPSKPSTLSIGLPTITGSIGALILNVARAA